MEGLAALLVQGVLKKIFPFGTLRVKFFLRSSLTQFTRLSLRSDSQIRNPSVEGFPVLTGIPTTGRLAMPILRL